MNLPSLTIAIAGINCAVAQSSTFTHNSTTYIWSFSGASSCNGSSVSTTMNVYVKNITGSYNSKEIIVKGQSVKTGSSTIVNQILFPLVTTQIPTICDSTGCVSINVGDTSFDWSALSLFSNTYNNVTKTLTVSSASSTASITTYIFDPIALDGSNKCSATATSCNITLTTANSNDIVIVICGTPNAGAGSIHCITPTSTGLTFTFRTSNALSTTNNVTEWYAIASSILSSATVVCKLSASTNFGCNAFGITGADTSTIFDTNAALPAKNTGTASIPTVTTVSTSNANDMLIGLTEDKGTVVQTGGSCSTGTCTLIQSTGVAPVVASEYFVVSSTQSSTTVAFGTSSGSTNTWTMIADAIRRAPVTVTQAIKITTSNSAPSGTISISGCAVSNATFTADGFAHTYLNITPSCVITLTTSGVTGSTRYEWNISPKPTISTTVTLTTCSSGTCSEYDNTTYYQLQNTYIANPNLPVKWDGIYTWSLTGTYLGTLNAVTSCPNTVSGGSSISCTSIWYNYNLAVTFPSRIGNTWDSLAPSSFTDTTGGNSHTVNYDQITGNTIIQTGDYSNFQSSDIGLISVIIILIICLIGWLLYYRR